ncbi:MAG: NIPSNAP family protein [Chloroflexi bacterium]|nr:NIPSNAP family protein [Chloroflexota bacterium]
MIYVMATCRVALENREKFLRTFREEWQWDKYGRKLVGQWETIIGPRLPREITDLWAFDDLAHRQREQEAVAKDPDQIRVISKLNGMLVEETIKVMAPLPLSPLK